MGQSLQFGGGGEGDGSDENVLGNSADLNVTPEIVAEVAEGEGNQQSTRNRYSVDLDVEQVSP